MAYEGIIPKSVINALNTSRKLTPIEAKLAGRYADPANRLGMGDLVHELDPTYFVPRGINTLRNANYGALGKAALNEAYGRSNPDDNRAAGFELLNLLGGALDVSPLAALSSPAKAGIKYAARELGPVANRRMERAMDDLGLRLNVIKPQHGNWDDDSLFRISEGLKDPQGNENITKWLQTAGKKYTTGRMGTPEDEIRLLLDQNISPLSEEGLRNLTRDMTRNDREYLRGKRRMFGMPEEEIASTQAGKNWETLTDEMINPDVAKSYQDMTRLREAMPWVERLAPEEKIYSFGRSGQRIMDTLGFNEMANALRREMAQGRLRPEQLNKVSVADAAKLAHSHRLADEASALSELPKLREYPEGFSWQELTNEDPDVLDKILQREGDIMQNCIGGYCSDVLDDGTRLFSLRDPAGNPHVNIEVFPGQRASVEKMMRKFVSDEDLSAMSDAELINTFKENFPALGERVTPESFNPKIKQIKGKQNEAPIEDYLPYVQDFVLNPVTRNPYSRVNDLENTGLIDLNKVREHGLTDRRVPGLERELYRIYPSDIDQFGGGVLSGPHGVRIPTFDMLRGVTQEMPGNYATPSSLVEYLQTVEPRPVEHGYSKYWEGVEKPEGFAKGGAVDMDHPEPDEAYEFRDFGLRQTGEPKEEGALGLIRMPDGMTDMTEYSINVDGKEMPSIIEGMHPADINYIRETGDVPEDAVRTAIHNARKREAQGKNVFYNRQEDKGYAEGGAVKDPFADMSMLDKVSLLARGAKKRYLDHYDAASKHGAYPDQLAAALKDKYLVELGNSRQNRTPLDVAINYGGGYDFAANKAVPAQDVKDMAKAYQLFDYMTSIRDSAKADAIGDYYENMAGVEAGLAGRSRGRMPEADIQRLSAEYGKRKATAAPAYTEGEYAEGGLVYNDYDEMFDFR